MNKLLSLVIFLAMTGIVTAKDIINEPLPNSIKNNIEVRNESKYNTNKKDAETQARGNRISYNGRTIRLDNNNLQHQFPGSTPIAFDPSSNLLSVAMTTFHFVGPNNVFDGTTLWQLRSTNNGQTWDSTFVFRDLSTTNAYAPMRPTLAFTNPTKSSNPEDVNYVNYGQAIYKNEGAGWTNTSRGKGLFVYYSPDFGIIPQKADGPTLGGNNNDPQTWGEIRMYGDDELNKVYGMATLVPTSINSQYGYYGFYSFDFSTSEETSNNPEQWWYKNFRPSDQKDRSFAAPISIGNDSEGNLYNVADHFYADDDQDRYVSFSKSTDEGKNWTSYNRMPRSVYNDFVSNFEENYTDWVVNGSMAYQPSELFVRGVDDFSYFTRLYLFNANDTSVAGRLFIMDMRYNNGTWSINPIQELESFGPTTFAVDDDQEDKLQLNAGISNSYGNNIKMSRTADGSKLILYWIDIVKDKYITFPPFQVIQSITNPATGAVTRELRPVDTLAVTDIFAKVYDVEQNKWGSTKNLTKDNALEYLMNVPDVIKSTKEAILITYESDKSITSDVTTGAPEAIIEVFTGRIPFIYSSVFDIDNLTSVETESTLKFNVELGDAFPNPAINTNTVSISFEVEKLSNVTVELYDQIGNKISTLYNNQSTAGYKAFNADISNLNSGAYYYQLNVNGFTFTKKLVVVK